MAFAALDFTDYSHIIAKIIIGVLITLFINYFIAWFSDGLSYFIFAMVLMFTAWGIVTTHVNSQTVYEENAVKAQSNLTQKYNILDASWESLKTPTRRDDSDAEGGVLVLAGDGKEYKFQYVVDEETCEPTLITSPESAIPAEALLR